MLRPVVVDLGHTADSIGSRGSVARFLLLQRNLEVSLGVSLAVSAILATLAWEWVEHARVLAWVGLVWSVTLARALVLYLQRRGRWEHAIAQRWFQLGVLLSGSSWGAAGFLIFPTAVEGRAVLAIVLGGMLVGSVGVYGASRATFLSFVLPLALPLIIRFALIGGRIHMTLALLSVVLFLAMCLAAERTGRATREALALSFENEDMVVTLEAANTKMEVLNQQLQSEVEERRRVEKTLRHYQESLVRTVEDRTQELSITADRLVQEVNERKRVEFELERTERLRALGVLAGGIAHDFNNLLTVVVTNLELIELNRQSDEVQDYAAAATDALAQAKQLTSQLLTFSRGGAPLRGALRVDELLENAPLMANQTNVRIELEIAPETSLVHGDLGQLTQVVNNMVLNAVQAMPEGGTVRIGADNVSVDGSSRLPLRPGRYVRIFFADEGAGIPAEDQSRIFDPYFTEKETGTGLGLSVCHSVITKHDGHISVRSEPGNGARFDVWLPAWESARSAPGTPPPTRAVAAATRVLVMDDELAVRKSLLAILRHLQMDADAARDGDEAIQMAQVAARAGRPYALIMLDLTVPGAMGGKEAAARLKSQLPKAVLVVSSGYSDDPVMAEPARFGFTGVLHKPYTFEQLRALLSEVLPTAKLSAAATRGPKRTRAET